MGSRLLKRWMALPLKDIGPVTDRLDTVEFMLKNPDVHENLEDMLRQIGDLERLVSNVAVGRINTREMYKVKNAIDSVERIKLLCADADNRTLGTFTE